MSKNDFTKVYETEEDFVTHSARYINSNEGEDSTKVRLSKNDIESLPSIEDLPYITNGLVMKEDVEVISHHKFCDALTNGGMRGNRTNIKKQILGHESTNELDNYDDKIEQNFRTYLEQKSLEQIAEDNTRHKICRIPTHDNYIKSTTISSSYISNKTANLEDGVRKKIKRIMPDQLQIGGANPTNVSYNSSKKYMQNNILVFAVRRILYLGSSSKDIQQHESIINSVRAGNKVKFFRIPMVILTDIKNAYVGHENNPDTKIKNIYVKKLNIAMKRAIGNVRLQRDQWVKTITEVTNNTLLESNQAFYDWNTDELPEYFYKRFSCKHGFGNDHGDNFRNMVIRTLKTVLEEKES